MNLHRIRTLALAGGVSLSGLAALLGHPAAASAADHDRWSQQRWAQQQRWEQQRDQRQQREDRDRDWRRDERANANGRANGDWRAQAYQRDTRSDGDWHRDRR